MKITVQTFSFGGWRSNEIKAPLRFDGKNLFLLKEIKKIEFLQLTSRKIAKLQFDEIFRESFCRLLFCFRLSQPPLLECLSVSQFEYI